MNTQASLLRQKRFLPYFLTQSLGAFNDNIYKNVFLILVAYSAPGAINLSTDIFINLAAGLFILPFLLFSAFAGVLTDKFEKSKYIQTVKIAEIVIMSFAAVAFIYESYIALLILLFLMGTQSAFFGPVKYSLLPQTLKKHELTTGNALVETGTFLSILFGTILAGIIAHQSEAKEIAAVAIVFFAVLGYLCSRSIPIASANNPSLKVELSPIKQFKNTLRIAHKDKMVLHSILGTSWFWFMGTCYLTQFPNYTKVYLGGPETVVSFLLTLFSIGITIGAFVCDKLSNGRIEPGLVPIGAIGLTIFGIRLAFSTPDTPINADSFAYFISQSHLWGVFFDLTMIGMFAGIFIVPLYAMMQDYSEDAERSQVIAAHNIYSSLFMVLSAVLAGFILGIVGISITEFFLFVAILNVFASLYICQETSIFMLRFLVWLFSHSFYRVTHKGLENIPPKGGVLLVCNHVSFADALLLGGACSRPIRFVMWADYTKLPALKYFFKASCVIPISYERKDIIKAFAEVETQLKAGEVVCIFPEGELTRNGELGEFRRGVDIILKKTPVPVVPLALKGLWGSFFSHKDGNPMCKWPRRFLSKVTIEAGIAVPAADATPERLRHDVLQLLKN